MMDKRALQCGFSLMEAIMVIAITGVLAGLVVSLAQPLIAYVGSISRADLSDEADTALQRIDDDLRLSLQSTVKVVSTSELDLSLTSGAELVSFVYDSAAGTLTRCSSLTACALLADNVQLSSFGLQSVTQAQGVNSGAQTPALVSIQLVLARMGETISLVRQFCVRCYLN
jgi:prepilin-type N-terminal cleavage/methylation domain-containing protein